MGRRKSREDSFLEDLLKGPWQTSVVVGVLTFIGLRWVLPSIGAGSIVLQPLVHMLSGLAWLFAGFFFLIGAIVFAKTAGARRREPSLRLVKPGSGDTAPSSRTIRAPRDRREPGIASMPMHDTEPPCPRHTPPEDVPAAWSIHLIREIEWKRFEDLCQKFYETKGIKSETTALGADGGIDIRLYQDDSGQPTSIVQCKAWGERQVGVRPIRELLGVMTHERIGKAFFMTSGCFSDGAKEVARSNRITLIDGEMLLTMIRRLPETDQGNLLAFATEGDYKTPTCPSCGIKMKHVAGTAGRTDFWGCHHYPRCRQTLGMRRKE